jgi:SNF2 family DNA or RNA helicase
LSRLDDGECTWERDVDTSMLDQYRECLRDTNSMTRPKWPIERAPDCFIYRRSPNYKNQHTLTPFQLDGFNWLNQRWHHHEHSVLGDDTGLGKTVQVLAHVEYLRWEEGIAGPFLVVAPLSAVARWVAEIAEWTQFRVVALVGSDRARKVVKEHCIFLPERISHQPTELIVDIIVASFELVIAEITFLSRIQCLEMIIDQAHLVRNTQSVTFQKCREFVAENFVVITSFASRIDGVRDLHRPRPEKSSRNGTRGRIFSAVCSN